MPRSLGSSRSRAWGESRWTGEKGSRMSGRIKTAVRRMLHLRVNVPPQSPSHTSFTIPVIRPGEQVTVVLYPKGKGGGGDEPGIGSPPPRGGTRVGGEGG